MQLYASRGYLESRGTLSSIEDISQHRLICQNISTPQVQAGASLVQHLMSHDIPSLLTVNNYFGVLQAVINDLGIGVLPDYIVEDFPSLVRVLPEVESGEVPVFLAYPEELRQSKRVTAFRDFVSEEVIAHRRRIRDVQEA
jgi:DNA-binding transcriptional LysR family regulator